MTIQVEGYIFIDCESTNVISKECYCIAVGCCRKCVAKDFVISNFRVMSYACCYRYYCVWICCVGCSICVFYYALAAYKPACISEAARLVAIG